MELVELDVLVGKASSQADKRSPLLKAKAKSPKGAKVNVCPFGCQDKNLDHNGYCKHLIGFTEDKVHYEPMVLRKGQRRVEVPMVASEEMELDDEGRPVPIMVPSLPLIQATDKICRISTCWRVYRNVMEQQRPADVAPAKKK